MMGGMEDMTEPKYAGGLGFRDIENVQFSATSQTCMENLAGTLFAKCMYS